MPFRAPDPKSGASHQFRHTGWCVCHSTKGAWHLVGRIYTAFTVDTTHNVL